MMARLDTKGGLRLAIIIPLLIVVIIAAAVGILYSSYQSSLEPIDANDQTEIALTIPKGAGTSKIAGLLESAGLIENATFFKLYSRLEGKDGQYKQGEYVLTKSMSTDEIIAALIAGISRDTVRFTIPEGYTTKQIMKVLKKEGIVTEDDFQDAVQNGDYDYRFLEGVPEGEARLDGFLYPETYEVYADATAAEVVDKMLSQFDKLFKPEYYDKAKEMGFTVREIVTMGSVIERESKTAEERPVMAGVFYNRLAKDMKLESCATIQYILGEPKEFLTYDDLAIESPYNTYLHEGLPPGPVCSPRIQSIEAALMPDDNDFIYFVVSENLDGTHNFSADYNKFLNDKNAYQQAVKNRQ
jgi:UPF0755 protein